MILYQKDNHVEFLFRFGNFSFILSDLYKISLEVNFFYQFSIFFVLQITDIYIYIYIYIYITFLI